MEKVELHKSGIHFDQVVIPSKIFWGLEIHLFPSLCGLLRSFLLILTMDSFWLLYYSVGVTLVMTFWSVPYVHFILHCIFINA